MHAADEVIPRGQGGKFLDPRFLAGDEIAFQPEAHGERRGPCAGFEHPIDVARQVGAGMRQSSNGSGRAWGMVGKADLRQSGRAGGGDVFERRAGRVVPQSGVWRW